jgi:hypothetical protein
VKIGAGVSVDSQPPWLQAFFERRLGKRNNYRLRLQLPYKMSALRDSVLIPSIKCSVCNADVEISLMGDHICARKQEGEISRCQLKSGCNTKRNIELSLSDFPLHSHSLPRQQLPRTDAGSASRLFRH